MNLTEINKTKREKSVFFYGWIVVAAALCVAVAAYAVHYSFGIFFKPLATEFGWTRAITSGAFSLYIISRGSFGILTGWATDKYGPRITVASGGFFICLGLLFTSQISTIWQLYLFYGLMVGLGVSVAFAPLTATVSRWFDKRRGLAVGIVVAGVGLGTAIMPRPAAYLISTYSWHISYIIMGLVALFVIGLAALLLRHSPEQVGLLPYGKTEADESKKVKKDDSSLPTGNKGLSFAGAVRTGPFWVLFVTTTLFGTCLYLVMVHIVPHATDIGTPLSVAANFMVVIGAASIIGRISMGSLADRIGSKPTLATCLIIQAIMVFCLLGIRDVRMFYVFAAIFGFTYGGCVPQLPLLAGKLFGLQSIGAIIGVEMLGTSIGGAVGPFLGGWVYDVTNSYYYAFLTGAIGLLIATLLLLFLRVPKRVEL